jgi:recombinational DNA repair protein (RecF pathway)
MKYEAISRNSARFPVKKMCEVFGLHVTNYYRWKQYQKKREEKREKELGLVRLIEGVFVESDKTYGYRAIKKTLEQKGTEISEYKIRKIMRENGFYPELDHCRCCERDLLSLAPSADPAKPEIVFDFALGGLVCGLCHGSGSGTRLSSGALRALRYMLEVPQEKVYAFTAQEDVRRQLDEVCVGYLLHQTEKQYNSLDFIVNLRR